jgi:hypothetical protein
VTCCPKNTICLLGSCTPFTEYAYDGGGLGKLVAPNAGVTVARLHLGGVTDMGTATSFAASADIQGGMSAYNYGTRTLVETTALTEASGDAANNGDIMLSGSGPALINGVAAPVVFQASKTAGVVTFEVYEASTMTPLAGGTGEAGRSSLALGIAQNV